MLDFEKRGFLVGKLYLNIKNHRNFLNYGGIMAK